MKIVNRWFESKCNTIRNLQVEVEWYLHSLDLVPLDAFFWKAIKRDAYEEKPSSLGQLNLTLRSDTCHRIVVNFAIALRACAKEMWPTLEMKITLSLALNICLVMLYS